MKKFVSRFFEITCGSQDTPFLSRIFAKKVIFFRKGVFREPHGIPKIPLVPFIMYVPGTCGKNFRFFTAVVFQQITFERDWFLHGKHGIF
jgi:hypothetical protein